MPTLSVSHAKHLSKDKKNRINAFDIIKKQIYTDNFIIETQLGEASFIRFKNLPIVFNLSVNNGFESKNVTDDYIIKYLTSKFYENIIEDMLAVINIEMLSDSIKKRSNNFLSLLQTGVFKKSYNLNRNLCIIENSELKEFVFESEKNCKNKDAVFFVDLDSKGNDIEKKAAILKVTQGLNLKIRIFPKNDFEKSKNEISKQQVARKFLEIICVDQSAFKILLKAKLKINASKIFSKNVNKFIFD